MLIIGASGGVGTFAVQLAKAFGAEVTAVCSTTKADMVRSIGADHVIDYTREDFADGSGRYDLILDIGGNSTLARLRRALTPKGTLVIAGGETGGKWLGGTDRQLRALVLSRFVSQKLTTFVSRENTRTCWSSPSSSRPGRSHQSSTGPTRWRGPKAIQYLTARARPRERSSLPSDTLRPVRRWTGVGSALNLLS